ncbi:DUF748 domain-containing protein [Pseudochryseolinea flava]|uniref:DUF748 domain-containing protein n=1 Tax=Pseudochryseolinea flava TaxID=2059302 RepID=A0A364XWU8_9BACT|nr:DUF748 domain-containing protein [Pseudochryseolinea flava]RAV98860.1 hypothetical protein DQQ10_21390 [Pseudochryseolinea flava]
MDGTLLAVIISVSLLILMLLTLPFIAKAIIKAKLHKIENYDGVVDDIKLNIFSSNFTLIGLDFSLRPQAKDQTITEIHIPCIYGSYNLGSLLRKKMEIRITLSAPTLIIQDNSSSDATEVSSNSGEINIHDHLVNFIPFKINIEIENGTVRYQKTSIPFDISLNNITVSIAEFSNYANQSEPCEIKASAFLDQGTIALACKLHPMEFKLSCHAIFEVKTIDLTAFNQAIKKYGKLDLNSGQMDLFGQLSVHDNLIHGHINPVLYNLDFISVQDKTDTLMNKVWERIVAGGVHLLLNKRDGKLATTVPIDGDLDDPAFNVKAAISGLFRNAFVKALTPTWDDVFIETPLSRGVRKVAGKILNTFSRNNKNLRNEVSE